MNAVLGFESLVLNFEEEIVLAENIAEKCRRLTGVFVFSFGERLGDFAFQAGGKSDQPFECSARNFLLTRGL